MANKLRTQFLFDGKFTRLFKSIYEQTSVKPLPKNIYAPFNLRPFLDTLYGAFNLQYILNTKIDDIPVYSFPSNNDVMVAYSGGKDSVACVLKLRDEGLNPHLFFMNGINKSYTQELETAKNTAEKLGCDITVYDVTITGKKEYVEHPIKDQFILAVMVDEGIKRQIYRYAFGTGKEDYVSIVSNDYQLSDAIEMFTSVEKFYANYIDNFQILIPLEHETESVCRIVSDKQYSDLIFTSYSCMTPLRYRENIIKSNQRKYNITLLPNNCGSCDKCCLINIILQKIGYVDYPYAFIKHCWEVLESMEERQLQSIRDKENSMDHRWIDNDTIKRYFPDSNAYEWGDA